MPSEDLIYCYNMIGAEFGLRSRLGWREHCTGLGAPGEQVRSILPYAGSSSANDKLFACTTTGIWDVTASSATPTRVVTFGTQNTDSGWGTSTVFVNAGGTHFLVYCDEANGFHSYEPATGWTVGGISGTPITGVTAANLVSVVSWKNRLWLVEKDTAKAWYLGMGAASGAATSFQFGTRFKAGGDLRNLFSWTQTSLSGIDDALVAVSGGGDLVVYNGTDPSAAYSFGIQGSGFLGAVPVGRRLATDFGGDLLLMSSRGLVPVSKVAGGSVISTQQYETRKIANLWNQLQSSTSTLRGWSMALHPIDNALMVTIPTATGQATQQLAMSLATHGWHQYRDMPMGVCAAPWQGTLYFGTEDGRVCANDGYVDGVTLAAPSSFSTINWSILTAFSNFGTSTLKQVQTISTSILAQGGALTHAVTPRFDWNMEEPAAPSTVLATGASAWDVALWDTGLWAGTYQTHKKVFGSTGIGRHVAIAVRGSSSYRITLTDLDVSYTEGGIL